MPDAAKKTVKVGVRIPMDVYLSIPNNSRRWGESRHALIVQAIVQAYRQPQPIAETAQSKTLA